MSLRRRSPRPLSGALRGLKEEWVPQTVLAEIQDVWPAVVGGRIASAARPVSERGGVLTVACDEAVWAAELDLMSATITSRLNERMASGAITRLRCLTRERQ